MNLTGKRIKTCSENTFPYCAAAYFMPKPQIHYQLKSKLFFGEENDVAVHVKRIAQYTAAGC